MSHVSRLIIIIIFREKGKGACTTFLLETFLDNFSGQLLQDNLDGIRRRRKKREIWLSFAWLHWRFAVGAVDDDLGLKNAHKSRERRRANQQQRRRESRRPDATSVNFLRSALGHQHRLNRNGYTYHDPLADLHIYLIFDFFVISLHLLFFSVYHHEMWK
jgi:hypothetical protein